ncbi:MAG: ankyrin repeat domain-containing protein [Proteobacteria bacterium]|nr:ankyrin repeat domain-containing protein [Pseudomonadota bacterium]
MLMKHPYMQFLVFFGILIPFVFVNTIFANTTNDELDADFIKAAFSGNLPEVKRLFEKGANVNAKRENGITALIGASIEGHQEVVEFLLSKGVEVDAKVFFFGRSDGATAYDLASQKDHQEIMKLLIRAGAYHEAKAAAPPPPPQPSQASKRNIGNRDNR